MRVTNEGQQGQVLHCSKTNPNVSGVVQCHRRTAGVFSVWGELKNQLYLGDETFAAALQFKLQGTLAHTEIPRVQRPINSPSSLAAVALSVARLPTSQAFCPSVGDHDQHTAWRMFDQCLGNRASPPASGPSVQMFVADYDQVSLDLAGAS